MTTSTWQYVSDSVVWRELPDGTQESCLVDTPELQAWLSEGNTPEPAPAPPAPKVLTPAEKLQAAGLSVDELKVLLDLPIQKRADPGSK